MAGAHGARFVARARTLRGNQTDAETRLWSRVRNRQLFGFKFVRQEQGDPYFADFACRERDLSVEGDGGSTRSWRTTSGGARFLPSTTIASSASGTTRC